MKLFSILLSLCLSSYAEAGFVKSIKGNKVLLELEGQDAKAGERFFLLDSAGKKKAIVVIKQVKNGKAVAEVQKGKPDSGYTLADSPLAGATAEGDKASKRSRYVSEYTGRSWGLLASVLQSSMSATFTPSGGTTKVTVDMKGMTFGGLGYYDYPVFENLQLRGLAGVEQLRVTGTADSTYCESSTDCNVSLTYLSMYGGAKYNFYNSGIRAWVGGFYGFLLALSKSSSVLKTSEITSSQVYIGSLGMDFTMKNSASYIPVTLEYGMFPSSTTVKANILYIRAGWGKSF